MMDAFAVSFCTSNTGLFSSKDTCYVLAFSVIMLATNLHNPAIKNKVRALRSCGRCVTCCSNRWTLSSP